ncbi:MAG: hypothetical protein NTY45_07520 [Elusimicrobia bacterium]|nr:hypothetical protein [Elusimicrobiota bacterium]
MKLIIGFLMLFPLLACKKPPEQPAAGAGQAASVPAAPGPALLAPAGDRNQLPGGGWFTWKFSEKPKLGTIIAKVQVFTSSGERDTSYEVTGESGMPSMRDHDSGPVKFQTNRKGDHLLPVNIVMAGEWQLLIRLQKDKTEAYAGKVLFSI